MEFEQIVPSCHPAKHSNEYNLLVQARNGIKQLRQVHAFLVVAGLGHVRSILTKLATFTCSAGSASYTRLIFNSIPNPDSFLCNTLIRLTSHSSKLSIHSLYFYRCMTLSCVARSEYTFTSVIKACADLAAFSLGRSIHSHSICCGYSLEPHVQSALITFYSKCGDVLYARKVFDEMPARSVVAWNSMISGYELNSLPSDAIALFHLMRDSNVEADPATFVSVLSACAETSSHALGKWVHDYIASKNVSLSATLGSALIKMYYKCGDLETARKVFATMKEKNVIAWTSMITALGVNGHGEEALHVFEEMKSSGCKPNRVTFIAILASCAHSGMLKEGRQVFDEMTKGFHITPNAEHQVAYVDLLGRAGCLEEAHEFISKIPRPCAATWTAMLGACKMHKNTHLAAIAARHLISLEPENSSHYVALSNVYASAGKMERVEEVRNVMIRKRLRKQVGYSTIEIEGQVHLFSMGDTSHAETLEIYKYLDELMWQCGEYGYVCLGSSVLHELVEEDAMYALRYHSEKLAIAYGLMRMKEGTVIRVVKNIRMCEDCHLAIKFISMVAKREIVVRDKLRFHHFKNGRCSCMDFW